MESEYQRLQRARENQENIRRAAEAAEKTSEAAQRAADAAEAVARLARDREEKIRESEANIHELAEQLRALESLYSSDPFRFLVFSSVIWHQRAWYRDLTSEALTARNQIESRIWDLRRQLKESGKDGEAKAAEEKLEVLFTRFKSVVDLCEKKILVDLRQKYLSEQVIKEQREWPWFANIESGMVAGGAVVEAVERKISYIAARLHFHHVASPFAYFLRFRDFTRESFFEFINDKGNGYEDIVVSNNREVEFNSHDFSSLKQPSKAIIIEHLTKVVIATESKDGLIRVIDRLTWLADEMEKQVGQFQNPVLLRMKELGEKWLETEISTLNLSGVYPLGRLAVGLSAVFAWLVGLGFWNALGAGILTFLALVGFNALPLSFRTAKLWPPQKRFVISFISPFAVTLLIAIFRRFA
jgi:hypothetical protein